MDLQLLKSENFNPGAIKDREDPRDFTWEEIGAALPPYDWTKTYSVQNEMRTALGDTGFTIPVKDQNTSYSCGGQGWGYYGAGLETIFTKTFEERSAKFIYSQTHAYGGGSNGRDNCQLVINQGWGLEMLTSSYNNGQPPTEAFMTRSADITDFARSRAKLSKALAYANTGNSIDSIAQAIQATKGVILGITGSNNGTWLSEKPAPPKNGQSFWYHWVWASEVGMFQGEKAVRILNSWGPSVGQQGWQWITESYFKAHISSSYGTSPIWSGWTLPFNLTTPPDAFQHAFNTNMTYGENNSEVLALQTALQVSGDFPASIAPSGFYGNATAAAVYKFQVRYGVDSPDRNHAGPKTRALLNNIFRK